MPGFRSRSRLRFHKDDRGARHHPCACCAKLNMPWVIGHPGGGCEKQSRHLLFSTLTCSDHRRRCASQSVRASLGQNKSWLARSASIPGAPDRWRPRDREARC
ncbi:unnamed protein product, partial [Ectocarpus fasciculatus]